VTRVDVPDVPDRDSDNASICCYRRNFNCPTGLDAESTVRLTISGWSGQLDSVTLNGHELIPDSQSLDVDVTQILERQNVIIVQLSATRESTATFSGEVSLVIT